MQLFRHWDLPAACKGGVVAIGNFDGVHRGHQMVIREAAAVAKELAAPLAVLSFEPHPRSVFRPDDPPFRLTPFRIRARQLEALGIDIHVCLHFDLDFARRSADWFAETVLAEGMGARHVAIGYDFCFGHNRQGNAETLLGYGRRHGFGVTVVTQASDESGGVYSSSRIRQLLGEGKPREAAALLGRPWEIEGRVEHGDKRGRTLDFPTANVMLGDYLRPAYGVYAVRAAVDEGRDAPVWRDGVANLGIRPMWQTDEPVLETFLFDFSGDLYGRHLRVQLVEFLRGERHFDGVEALVAQMRQDTEAARAALAAAG
ncbi:MAG: bifunctional riboflavin kinase/FAD synthetase [Deinococcus-Thermus bacterium]|nr:bifunctional riboflavin kinase/FAD synthetase [Deinococcota bacterium]